MTYPMQKPAIFEADEIVHFCPRCNVKGRVPRMWWASDINTKQDCYYCPNCERLFWWEPQGPPYSTYIYRWPRAA